jgi:hypothetical protein
VVAADAEGRAHRFAFVWDCRWRADEQGWIAPSGTPDQARAARVFGWRCFAEWRALGGSPTAA